MNIHEWRKRFITKPTGAPAAPTGGKPKAPPRTSLRVPEPGYGHEIDGLARSIRSLRSM